MYSITPVKSCNVLLNYYTLLCVGFHAYLKKIVDYMLYMHYLYLFLLILLQHMHFIFIFITHICTNLYNTYIYIILHESIHFI